MVCIDQTLHYPHPRKNQLGVAGWTTVADTLEITTSITSLNGCDQYAAIRGGGLRELKLGTEWELGLWAVRFLERSSSTLTKLNVRCLETLLYISGK